MADLAWSGYGIIDLLLLEVCVFFLVLSAGDDADVRFERAGIVDDLASCEWVWNRNDDSNGFADGCINEGFRMSCVTSDSVEAFLTKLFNVFAVVFDNDKVDMGFLDVLRNMLPDAAPANQNDEVFEGFFLIGRQVGEIIITHIEEA